MNPFEPQPTLAFDPARFAITDLSFIAIVRAFRCGLDTAGHS